MVIRGLYESDSKVGFSVQVNLLAKRAKEERKEAGPRGDRVSTAVQI